MKYFTDRLDATPEVVSKALRSLRERGYNVTFKEFLAGQFDGMTPEKFYYDNKIDGDMHSMTMKQMLTTTGHGRYILPEIWRDNIQKGLEYEGLSVNLVARNENIAQSTILMPSVDFTKTDYREFEMHVVNEGAEIPIGYAEAEAERTVRIFKRGRGLVQTYEAARELPVGLAALYFQNVGKMLTVQLDNAIMDVLLNGDQANGSLSVPVMGVESTSNGITYNDIVRAWVRQSRLHQTSRVMLANEATAMTILAMDAFQRTLPANGAVNNPTGTVVNIRTPLPTSQDIYINEKIPDGKVLFVNPSRAIVQLTNQPLMIESDKDISKQINRSYASIITGFANIDHEARLLLDGTTTYAAAPGPVVPGLTTTAP